MKSFATLVTTGAFFAAITVVQGAQSAQPSSTTTTALNGEGADSTSTDTGPPGYNMGSSSSSSPSSSATDAEASSASNVDSGPGVYTITHTITTTAGASGVSDCGSLPTRGAPLPPKETVTVVIDGITYVPKTTGMDPPRPVDPECSTGSGWLPYGPGDGPSLATSTTNGGVAHPDGGHAGQSTTTTETGATSQTTGGTTLTSATRPGETDLPASGYGDNPSATTATSATGANDPAPSSATATAHIKLFSGNESRNFDVPISDTLTHVKGYRAEKMTIVSISPSGDGGADVKCTAFKDKAGKEKLGQAVKADEKVDVGKDGEKVKVKAFRCSTEASVMESV